MEQFKNNESMKQYSHKKIALVHDFLVSYGGAERVLETLCEMYPEAPIYTLLYDKERMGEHFRERDIRTSWLGKLPRFIQKRYRIFLPFFPAATESFDLREFDLVISSSGAWGKGIVTRLNTIHVAYIHSPMRYAWDYHESYLQELGARFRRSIFTRMLMSYMRIWDKQAAERPDLLVANSCFTAERIKKYYRRDAEVVYPPVTLYEHARLKNVESDSKETSQERTYFLVVSRLTRSKKIDAVIATFNKLSLPLMVVGSGAEEKKLKNMAGKQIRFSGFVSDVELARLYLGARALIVPSEEDFGIVAVEASSFGVPVIGLNHGGIREIITPGETGELFRVAEPEIIAEGVRRFLQQEGRYSILRMQESAMRFSKENFQKQMERVLENYFNQKESFVEINKPIS